MTRSCPALFEKKTFKTINTVKILIACRKRKPLLTGGFVSLKSILSNKKVIKFKFLLCLM
ncbi:hypothetical protein Zm00014a_036185 [Zea mays]|uniref:Uncharacterized protein n=1 Tax=Zea mays TaxID=4577 RepID=A0A3L6DZS9_MAIZE|nr:hypothetical protein Zm00014a_036185 [Zea mays]